MTCINASISLAEKSTQQLIDVQHAALPHASETRWGFDRGVVAEISEGRSLGSFELSINCLPLRRRATFLLSLCNFHRSVQRFFSDPSSTRQQSTSKASSMSTQTRSVASFAMNRRKIKVTCTKSMTGVPDSRHLVSFSPAHLN